MCCALQEADRRVNAGRRSAPLRLLAARIYLTPPPRSPSNTAFTTPWQMEGVCRLRSPSPRPAPSCAGLPPERQGPNGGMEGEKKRRQGGRESGAKCLHMPAAPPGARTRTTAGRGLPHTHPTPQPDPPSPCDEPRPTRAPQARTFRSPYIGTPGRVQEAGLVGGNGRSGGRQAGGESLCVL